MSTASLPDNFTIDISKVNKKTKLKMSCLSEALVTTFVKHKTMPVGSQRISSGLVFCWVLLFAYVLDASIYSGTELS